MRFVISAVSFYFLFFLVCNSNLAAQVKKPAPVKQPGKDRMLWYRGTKQNDSVLITNSGWKIVYKKAQQQIEVKTGMLPVAWQKIASELDRSKARKTEMIRRIAGERPDPSQLPQIRLAMMSVGDIENQYRDLLKNTIDLRSDDPALEKSPVNSFNSGPAWNEMNEAAPWKEIYEQIKADIRSLKDPESTVPGVPPDFDVSICMFCDTLAKKRLAQEREDYLAALKNEEQRIVQNIFHVFKIIGDMADKNGGEFTPETKAVNDELVQALGQMQQRITKKLQRLVAAYRHDFLKLVGLIPLILGLDRQQQLLGIGEELPPDLALSKIITAADVNAYIKKIIEEEDYERVLNISWILSTERQFQLMGEEGIMMGNEFQKVLDFNRFKMTVSADAKVERDHYYSKGQVKSETAYYKATPTKDCRFAFIQSNGATSMGVGNPFINFNLLQAESSEGSYIGNKKWVMIDPYIKIGFCNADDTLRLFPIIPSLDIPYENWQTDIGPQALPIVTGLFTDAFENNDNMVDAGDEMLEKMQAVQKITADLSTAEKIVLNPMQLNSGYFIVESIKENFALNALTLVPVSAKNKSTVLFDQLYNGKLFSSAEGLAYANLWIKLEHLK